jgi:transposase-like protein
MSETSTATIARKQSIPAHLRYTIKQFNADFPDDDACLEFIKEMRWPKGIAFCKKCRASKQLYRISGRMVYACDSGHQIAPLKGTIFQKSTTSLRLWFYAMYLMGSTRCGISAKQIQRETGVTYKCAWRMFKQIRTLLSEDDLQLAGAGGVEMDETYMGGKRKGVRGRPPAGDPKKKCVIGMVERKGRVLALAGNDATRESLHGIAKERILPKSTIFTDEYVSYDGLDGENDYIHRRINHAAGVYVVVHTNTIDGFWSLVKRGIAGVYHSVSAKYLQSYLNEYSFRYNRRDQGNLIFTLILKQVGERAL